MKPFTLLLTLVFTTFFSVSGQESRLNRLTNPTTAELSERFVEYRHSGYGPAEALFWNERLSESLIRETLEELAAEHIREFFLYSTFGLDVEYLSDDYFRFYRFALDEAKRLGMKLWLYDEYSWPTGFAGGKLAEALPDAAAKGVRFDRIKPTDPLPENTLGVYAPIDGGFKRLADGATQDERIVARVQYAGREARLAGGFYCDMLKAGVTEKFIEITHEAYRKHSGDEFGKTVPGVFTDEMTLDRAGGVQWTDALAARFEQKFGYSVFDVLPLLEFDGAMTLENGRRVTAAEARHHHKSVLLDLVIERWSEPLWRYCEENSLEFSGHYEEHLWAYSTKNPDTAALYVWHQRPTLDIIFNDWGREHNAQAGNVRIVRELGSVAAQIGRGKTSSETCAASGWGLLPRDIKRLADWQFALGVTNPVEMGPQLSVRGTRKFDEGPSLFFHQPWWKDYDKLVDYQTRISYLMAQGKRDVDLIVFQPTTSLWLVSRDKPRCEALADAFCETLHALESRQVEYDLGSEWIAERFGSVTSDGLLKIGEADYLTVVLPDGFSNIEKATLALLQRFAATSGNVILLGDAPERIAGVPVSEADPESAAIYRQLFGDAASIADSENDDATDNTKWPRRNKSVLERMTFERFLETPWNASTLFFKVDHATNDEMNGVANSEISLNEYYADRLDIPLLYHQRRVVADGEILLFVNSDPQAERRFNCLSVANVSGESDDDTFWSSVQKYDPENGAITDFPHQNVTVNGKNATQMTVTLPPVGSLIVVLTRGKTPAQDLMAPRFAEKTLEPDSTLVNIERLDPNVQVIDYCSLKIGDKTFDEDYFYRIDLQLWRHFGFSQNPWRHIPQTGHEIMDRTFEPGKGFTVTYRFEIDASYFTGEKSPMNVVVERPEQYEIRCNGQILTPTNDWWFEKSAKKVEITEAIRPGENELSLTLETMNVFCDIVPLYLLGDFDVIAAASGFRVMLKKEQTFEENAPVESYWWKNRGLPFYNGRVAYRRTFHVKLEPEARYFVDLGKIGNLGQDVDARWNAAVAHVLVNGNDAGAVMFEPCRVDATPYLIDGENKIEVVLTGSARNLCGPHYAGKYYIHRGYYGDFEKAPAKRPAGTEYDLIPYGLTEPFRLFETIPDSTRFCRSATSPNPVFRK